MYGAGAWTPVAVPVAGLGRPCFDVVAVRHEADASATPVRGLLRIDSLPEGLWTSVVVVLAPAPEVCATLAAYKFETRRLGRCQQTATQASPSGRTSQRSRRTSLAMSRNTSAPVVTPLEFDEAAEEEVSADSHTTSSFRAALAHSLSIEDDLVADDDAFTASAGAPLFNQLSPRLLNHVPRHHKSRLGSTTEAIPAPLDGEPDLAAVAFTPEHSSTPRARTLFAIPAALAMAADTALGSSYPDSSEMRQRSRCIERSSAASSTTSLSSSLNASLTTSLNRSQPGSAKYCDSPGRARFAFPFAMDDDEPRRSRGCTLPTHASEDHVHMLPVDLRRKRAESNNVEVKSLLRRSNDDGHAARMDKLEHRHSTTLE